MRCSSAEWIARNGCWRWLPWDDVIVVSAGKLRKLWDSLSELRSSLCERRLEKTVLRPALLPCKTAQFTQFFRQIWRNSEIAYFNWECIGRLKKIEDIKTMYFRVVTNIRKCCILSLNAEPQTSFMRRSEHFCFGFQFFIFGSRLNLIILSQ